MADFFDFSGKTAVVTGAASGIGRATAEMFLKFGANVVLLDINEEPLKEAAASLSSTPGSILVCKYDAGDSESANEAVATAVRSVGSIDYVVMAAAVWTSHTIEGMADHIWRRTMAVNLDGVFYLSRAAIPHLNKGGAIVPISSVAGHRGGNLEHVHYGTTKGGVDAFVRGLAKELGPDIRVNGVAPGIVDTPLIAGSSVLGRLDTVLLKRAAQPSEIASVAMFLCSPAASFITGEIILATGGMYIG